MPEIGLARFAGQLQLEDLKSGRVRCGQDGNIHEKSIPFAIVAQVLAGEYVITRRGQTEHIAPGEAFLTSANEPLHIVHRFNPRRASAMESRWVHFRFSLAGTLDPVALLDLPLRLPRGQAQEIGEMIDSWLSGAPDAVPTLARLAKRQEFGCGILARLAAWFPFRPESAALLSGVERLQPMTQYIREHLGRPISLADLARQVRLSPSRLHALCRTHLGCPPLAYVRKLRLEEAARQLLATDEPLYRIALVAGFCNQFHFSRDFKRTFGLSPSLYRRNRWENQIEV